MNSGISKGRDNEWNQKTNDKQELKMEEQAERISKEEEIEKKKKEK